MKRTKCKTCGCDLIYRRPWKEKVGLTMIGAGLLFFGLAYFGIIR